MHTVEEKLESLLHHAEERERRARKRAIIYSLIPIALVLLLILFTSWRIKQTQRNVAVLNEEAERYRAETVELQGQLEETNNSLQNVTRQLQSSREAIAFVTDGINLYHGRRYDEAVMAYNRALNLDPQNAYVLNLKGYSLFKARRLNESIETLRKAVELAPNYAYGYFDLARVSCAVGKLDEASNAIGKAIDLWPELSERMKRDGEFTQLCRPLLNQIK
jgi:tetratricopeptide (TPR) repeat protein